MLKVINVPDGVHIKNWASILDDNALEQIKNLAQSPGVFHHIAVMPDAHLGKGCTIGTVFATKDIIYPSTVGVDIGCGVLYAPLKNINKKEIIPFLPKIHSEIKRNVPLGFNGNKEVPKEWDEFYEKNQKHSKGITQAIESRAPLKFGTLGGGNHFCELTIDEKGTIGIILHSGSRNIGNRIGQHYAKLAKQINDNYHIKTFQDLNYLSLNMQEGWDYIKDMSWAQKYASANRELIFKRVCDALEWCLPNWRFNKETEIINVHHNFSRLENHFGNNVWVTRKGATSAKEGEFGLIPGSMGTGSYVVKGLGNKESFCSCSHGAGRKMSRNIAKKTLSLEIFKKQMEGIVADVNMNLIDEAPDAYKDISSVMEDQNDLICPITKLTTILNVKG